MKKIVSAVLSFVLMAGLLTGCSHSSEKETELKNIKIGISVYNQYDTFISEMMNSVEEYVQVMEERYDISITLDIQNAGNNQVTQNDQMSYFIDRDCDIVCINLVDRTDASTIIERGKSANIPIIFFNRELVEEDLERWDKLYYVGADAFESGIIQGEILNEALEQYFDVIDSNGDHVIQYVMLEGEAGHQDSIVRTMYAVNTVTEAGYEVEKLADEIANWNRDQAKTKMQLWLQEFGDEIEVIFANNDDMALGARDVLREAGYYDKPDRKPPVILGIDGTTEGIRAVENEEFLGTVLNDSNGQARGMMELAYAVVSGNEISSEFTLLQGKYIRLPYQKIVKDNENLLNK